MQGVLSIFFLSSASEPIFSAFACSPDGQKDVILALLDRAYIWRALMRHSGSLEYEAVHHVSSCLNSIGVAYVRTPEDCKIKHKQDYAAAKMLTGVVASWEWMQIPRASGNRAKLETHLYENQLV